MFRDWVYKKNWTTVFFGKYEAVRSLDIFFFLKNAKQFAVLYKVFHAENKSVLDFVLRRTVRLLRAKVCFPQTPNLNFAWASSTNRSVNFPEIFSAYCHIYLLLGIGDRLGCRDKLFGDSASKFPGGMQKSRTFWTHYFENS